MLPCGQRARSRWSWRRRRTRGSTHVVRSAARAEPRRRARGAADESVAAFIETPRGSRTKYELDRSSGHIRLDRVLFSSVHYPADYGFVMDTVGGDGDPLDAVVIVEEPTFPGCVVRARPVGTLFMDDEHGNDEKILAVPVGDPRFDEITRLDDLAAHWRREIETFFATYKELEQGKTAAIKGWRDADVAWRLVWRPAGSSSGASTRWTASPSTTRPCPRRTAPASTLPTSAISLKRYCRRSARGTSSTTSSSRVRRSGRSTRSRSRPGVRASRVRRSACRARTTRRAEIG